MPQHGAKLLRLHPKHTIKWMLILMWPWREKQHYTEHNFKRQHWIKHNKTVNKSSFKKERKENATKCWKTCPPQSQKNIAAIQETCFMKHIPLATSQEVVKCVFLKCFVKSESEFLKFFFFPHLFQNNVFSAFFKDFFSFFFDWSRVGFFCFVLFFLLHFLVCYVLHLKAIDVCRFFYDFFF